LGGHRLAEPKELNGEVDLIDYCDVIDVYLYDNSDKLRIHISHPTEVFGFNGPLWNCKNEHCFLCMGELKTGYDCFYTLKPDTWKKDLKRMYESALIDKENNYQEELRTFANKLNIFFDAEEKINRLSV